MDSSQAPAGLCSACFAMPAVSRLLTAPLSFLLQVRTLELEMEYIYVCLEDEALDIGGRGIKERAGSNGFGL